MDQLCGARIDLDATKAYCDELAERGHEPLFGDARPDLASWGDEIWRIRGYTFLWDAEIKLFGQMLPTWVQQYGTCVGQAHGRAQQDSYYYALAFGGAVGKPITIAWEFIYGKSRTLPGTQRYKGDGSSGVYAAQAAHDYGMVSRGVYGTIDLSSNREDLARQWADSAVPKAVTEAASRYKAEACMRCMNTTDVRNAILAGYAVARCSDRATGAVRDVNGMARPVRSGGHAELLRGVFKDMKGRVIFCEQNSWPEGAGPHGGGPIKLYNGTTRDLPQGCAGIYEEDVDYYCRTGEVWAVAPPKTGWVQGIKPSEIKP